MTCIIYLTPNVCQCARWNQIFITFGVPCRNSVARVMWIHNHQSILCSNECSQLLLWCMNHNIKGHPVFSTSWNINISIYIQMSTYLKAETPYQAIFPFWIIAGLLSSSWLAKQRHNSALKQLFTARKTQHMSNFAVNGDPRLTRKPWVCIIAANHCTSGCGFLYTCTKG